MDKAGPQSDLFNNLTAVTYEAIIRVDDFSKHSEISTIMGVENYLLLRIGDASFPRQQLQFDGTGDSGQYSGLREVSQEGRIETPGMPGSGTTSPRRTATPRARSASTSTAKACRAAAPTSATPPRRPSTWRAGPSTTSTCRDPVKNEQYKGWGTFRQFFLGKSYDDTRQLNGDITEVRV